MRQRRFVDVMSPWIGWLGDYLVMGWSNKKCSAMEREQRRRRLNKEQGVLVERSRGTKWKEQHTRAHTQRLGLTMRMKILLH